MDFTTPHSALRGLLKRLDSSAPEYLGASSMQRVVDEAPEENFLLTIEVEGFIKTLLDSTRWESVCTGLHLVTRALRTSGGSAQFEDDVLVYLHKNLENSEPRVRSLVVEVIEIATKQNSLKLLESFGDRLAEVLKTNLELSADIHQTGMELEAQKRMLEISLNALRAMIQGGGRTIAERVTGEFRRHSMEGAAVHQSRYVREAAFRVTQSFISAYGDLSEEGEINEFLCGVLTTGNQDNWSEVRYAASVTTRTFLMALEPIRREPFLPLLLPRMCLNRYYRAEGVRLYAQESWKLLFGEEGRDLVAKYSNYVASYYLDAIRMDEVGVKEAACHSMGEFLCCIDPDSASPYLAHFITALLTAYEDEEWPVRDAACVATGKILGGYSGGCRPFLTPLIGAWFKQLHHPVGSARENAAVALGEAIKAFGEEVSQVIITTCAERLQEAKHQTSEESENLYHTSKTHKDEPLLYCSSMTPRLRAVGGSFINSVEERPPEPWEISDGAVYLVRELSTEDVAQGAAIEFLPVLKELAELHQFEHSHRLRETVFTCLPTIFTRLGKKETKRHLDLFISPLYDSLDERAGGTHGHSCMYAAVKVVKTVSALIGPSIYLARLPARLQEVHSTHPLLREGGS